MPIKQTPYGTVDAKAFKGGGKDSCKKHTLYGSHPQIGSYSLNLPVLATF